MKKLKLIIIMSLTIYLTSCMSYTANQTGRTIGKNNKEFIGNIDYLGNTDDKGILGSFPIFSPTIGLTYGLGQNLDIGCFAGPSQIGGSFKYQFCGNKESVFASSIGFNGGIGLGEFNGISNLYNYNIQSFNSFHSNEEKLAFFINAKYMFLQFSETTNSISTFKRINTPGYSIGIVYGDKNKFSFGFSNYFTNKNVFIVNVQNKELISSITLGFSHRF